MDPKEKEKMAEELNVEETKDTAEEQPQNDQAEEAAPLTHEEQLEKVGEHRKSSVPALKLSPKIPILRCPLLIIVCTALRFCISLLWKILLITGTSTYKSCASVFNAFISFGRQEPPYANPGLK